MRPTYRKQLLPRRLKLLVDIKQTCCHCFLFFFGGESFFRFQNSGRGKKRSRLFNICIFEWVCIFLALGGGFPSTLRFSTMILQCPMGSLWKMPYSMPGPLPQKSGALYHHHISYVYFNICIPIIVIVWAVYDLGLFVCKQWRAY